MEGSLSCGVVVGRRRPLVLQKLQPSRMVEEVKEQGMVQSYFIYVMHGLWMWWSVEMNETYEVMHVLCVAVCVMLYRSKELIYLV